MSMHDCNTTHNNYLSLHDALPISLFTVDKLTVNKGEWLTLEGPNGSGKTTFLNSIMKLIPSHGSIKFKGKVIKDRKSTRLNSSHVSISYAVFCLKKKKTTITIHIL